MLEQQTVTVNLDQIENQTTKAVMKALETYRMVIDAQGKQIEDLLTENKRLPELEAKLRALETLGAPIAT